MIQDITKKNPHSRSMLQRPRPQEEVAALFHGISLGGGEVLAHIFLKTKSRRRWQSLRPHRALVIVMLGNFPPISANFFVELVRPGVTKLRNKPITM